MNDDTHSGIPTQAIHEAYLDMQRALKAYRQAKDRHNDGAIDRAHGELQEAVLTFYELLRPHLRHESGVQEYWSGECPSYNGDGTPPAPEDGAAILQVQTTTRVADLPDNYEQLDTLHDWHDALGMNGNCRITSLAGKGDSVVMQLQQYQMGLKNLDEWETKYKRVTQSKGGFYEKKEKETVERQRIPIDRLRRAARELSEVADKLGALSEFDASRTTTQITDEDIKRLEKWRQQQLDE